MALLGHSNPEVGAGLLLVTARTDTVVEGAVQAGRQCGGGECGACAGAVPGGLIGLLRPAPAASYLTLDSTAVLSRARAPDCRTSPAGAQVALACVSFWQDTYLAQLLQSCAPPPAAGAQQTALQAHIAAQQAAQRLAMLQGHLPLLGQLLAGLVSRAALGTEAAATATADARDLPEEVRMVSVAALTPCCLHCLSGRTSPRL